MSSLQRLASTVAGLVVPLLLVTVMSGVAAQKMGAQICDNIGCDSLPPIVTVSSDTVVNPVVTVTVTWCDDNALLPDSILITLNGQDVTSQFSLAGASGPCQDDATSTGTLTLSPGTNTIVATIRDYVQHIGSGTGTYLVLNGAVEVLPKGLVLTKPINASLNHSFTVKNLGVNSATFTLASTCSGVASGCSVQSSIVVGPDSLKSVSVSYQTSGTGGAGTVGLRARLQTDTTVADSGSLSLTTTNSLLVDASMMNQDARNHALCANDCFAAVHAIGTTSYFSLDEPRGVTLASNSDWSDVHPILHFHITHLPGADPNIVDYTLMVEDSATATSLLLKGSFSSGGNIVRYVRNNNDATGLPFRMTTAITDDNWLKTKPTGVYTLNVYVKANRSGFSETDTLRLPFLHVREPAGFVARGWYVAGLQRLIVATGGRVVIVEGGGSAYVFSCDTLGTCASPSGDFTRLRRTGSGGSTTYTRSYSDSSRIWFSAGGLMDSSATAWGVKTRYKYDGAGRLTRIHDPFRARPDSASVKTHIELVYSTSPHQVEIRAPKPDGSLWDTTRVSILRLNSDTSLRAMIHADGDSTRFTYHSATFGPGGRNGQLNMVYDRNGKLQVEYRYDGTFATRKLLETYTGPTQYYRYAAGSGFTWNNYSARTWTETWEVQGMPASTTIWVPQPMQRADSIRSKVQSPGGRWNWTRHDRWGQVLDVISNSYKDLAGTQYKDTTYFYRSGIPADAVRHPAGAIDRYSYSDHGGRPVLTMSHPAGHDSTFYSYDAFGQVSMITGARTVKQEFYRNTATGNPLKVEWTRVADAFTTTFNYDSFGRLTSTTDPSGQHTTGFAYDSVNGNLRRTQQPGARVDSVSFDGYGRVDSVASHGNVKRVYQYDRLNRLTRDSLAGDARATRYFAPSTEKEFITHVEDPQGLIHKRSVNIFGWTVRQYDAADTTRFDSLMYNLDGLPSGRLNRRGQRVSWEYDNVDRLFNKTATSNVTSDSIGYGYLKDGTGKRIRMVTVFSNSISRDSIIADTLGWVEKVITKIGNKRFVRTYTRTPYFALDEVSLKVHLYGAADTTNGAVTFCKRRYGRRDSTHAIDTVSTCPGYESPISLTRNVDGLPSARTYPYSSQAFDYTTRHEIYNNTFSPTGLRPLERNYAYNDSLGRMTQLSWHDGLTTQVRAYSYTQRGELRRVLEGTLASCPPPSGFVDDGAVCLPNGNLDTTRVLKFTYDSASNLTSQLDSLPNITTTATYQGTRLTGWNGVTYTYDRDGNDTTRVSGGNTTYFTFSADNRLTQVRLGGDTVLYEYNALGQLVRRKRNGKVERLFFWDGDQLVAEMDSSGVQRIAEYIYWPGIDRPLAIVTGLTAVDSIRYYAQDELGNVHGMWTERAGSVTLNQQLDYEPWGSLTAGSVTGTLADTSRLRWKGTLWEGGNTNLYYMRNRWYDPASRRFVGEDPLGAGTNLYAFADNDPLNYSDPSGARPCDFPGEIAHSDWSGTGSPGAMEWEEFTHWCPMGGSMRPPRGRGQTVGPHPLGDGGSGIGPGRPGPSRTERGAACTAASIDFATAFVTDLISVTGIGMVATKGTQGARLAIKAARATRWHFIDRAGGGLLPRNGRLGTLGKWSAGAIGAGTWEVTSHAAQGRGFNWLEEVGELIPGVNSYLQGRDVFRACF